MKKTKDLIVIILLPILAAIISLTFKATLILSIILFFGIPSLYLSIRNKKIVKKTFLFSTISIPIAIIVDYFAERDGAWYVPDTVFPYKIFGFITIEGIIWLFLMTYFIIIFYEYFIDSKGYNKINRKFKTFELFFFSLLVIIIILHLFFDGFSIPYFYLVLGILLIFMPIIFYLKFKPKFISRYAKVAVYFSSVFFIHEITGLQLNHWTFPGENFIGWVTILEYSFPLEEFLFWIALSSLAIVSYYEYFADDQK